MAKYKSKYLLDRNDNGELKGYEVNKIIHGIEKENNRLSIEMIITCFIIAGLILYLVAR